MVVVLQFLGSSDRNDPRFVFQILAGSCGKFAPFEIRENMVLAPLCRVILDPDFLEQLDKLLRAQNSDISFLRDLKCRKPRKTGPTFVRNSTDIVNRLECALGFFCLVFLNCELQNGFEVTLFHYGGDGRMELFFERSC